MPSNSSGRLRVRLRLRAARSQVRNLFEEGRKQSAARPREFSCFRQFAGTSFRFRMGAGSIDTGNSDVTYKHKDSFYAKKFSRSIRTIQNWRSVGAPLDDAEAMDAFIKLKERNKTGKRLPSSEMKAPEIAPEELAAVKRGAEAALQRLVEQEARCSAELSAAQAKRADQDLVEMLMSRWLRVSGELRSFNLAIEKFRKETGEIIQRDKVTHGLGWLALWLKLAFQRLSNVSAATLAAIEDPAELQKRLNSDVSKAVWGSLDEAVKRAPGDLDEWLAKQMVIALHGKGVAPTDG
jgi:hypothetical protein